MTSGLMCQRHPKHQRDYRAHGKDANQETRCMTGEGKRGGGGLSMGGGRYTGSGRQRRRRRRRQAWFDCRRYVPDDTKLPPPPAEAACRGAGGPCERNTLPVEEGASAGAPGGVSMLRFSDSDTDP